MELRHLRYFKAAAEEEHFGRAAERLHVTRPAVSQLIADLESELNTQLFERLAHRVRLTDAGKALLPRLDALMNDLHDALAMTKRVGEGKSGALTIGYGSLTLLHSLFRGAIKRFRDDFPDVTLSLVEQVTIDQHKALQDGKIQAGFMHFGPDKAHLRKRKTTPLVTGQDRMALEWVKIQTGKVGVVMLNDHPLAAKKSVKLAELANERFVVVPRGISSPGHGAILEFCRGAGFEPRIVQEVSTTVSQLNLVSVGMGIGLSIIGKNFLYPPELTVLPISDMHYPTTFVFAWVKGERTPALDRMIEIVESLAG